MDKSARMRFLPPSIPMRSAPLHGTAPLGAPGLTAVRHPFNDGVHVLVAGVHDLIGLIYEPPNISVSSKFSMRLMQSITFRCSRCSAGRQA